MKEQTQPVVHMLVVASTTLPEHRLLVEAWASYAEAVLPRAPWLRLHLVFGSGADADALPPGLRAHALIASVEESFVPGIMRKTVEAFDMALQMDPPCTHVLRTNLSSLWNPGPLLRWVRSQPPEAHISGYMGDHGGRPFLSGAGMLISREVALFTVRHQDRLDATIADDVALSWLWMPHFTPRKAKRNDSFWKFPVEHIHTVNEIQKRWDPDSFHYRLKQEHPTKRWIEPLLMKSLIPRMLTGLE